MAVGNRVLACLLLAASTVPLQAQTPSVELDLTGGYSGEAVRAAATQLRLFGEVPAGIKYFAEASWGCRWAGDSPVIGGGLIGAAVR